MKNSKASAPPPRIKSRHGTLRPETIEKTFIEAAMDLKEVIVLDGINILNDNSGFRVRSHDLYGSLPDIVMEDSGDTIVDKDRISTAACKLYAIVKLRDQMRRWMRGGKFLLPTKVCEQATVGFKVGPKTWLAEGKEFLAAYHELHRQVVG